MSDNKLDDQLRQFLDDSNRERARGYTNANILLKIEHLVAQVTEVVARLDHLEGRVDRHGREIRAIKTQLEYTGESDTGQHSVEAIQREVERQKLEHDLEKRAQLEQNVWWKRSLITWIVGAVAFVVVQVISVMISVAISGAHK